MCVSVSDSECRHVPLHRLGVVLLHAAAALVAVAEVALRNGVPSLGGLRVPALSPSVSTYARYERTRGGGKEGGGGTASMRERVRMARVVCESMRESGSRALLSRIVGG